MKLWTWKKENLPSLALGASLGAIESTYFDANLFVFGWRCSISG